MVWIRWSVFESHLSQRGAGEKEEKNASSRREWRSVWIESLLISDFSALTALLVNGSRRMKEGRWWAVKGPLTTISLYSFSFHCFLLVLFPLLFTHSLSIAFYSFSFHCFLLVLSHFPFRYLIYPIIITKSHPIWSTVCDNNKSFKSYICVSVERITLDFPKNMALAGLRKQINKANQVM